MLLAISLTDSSSMLTLASSFLQQKSHQKTQILPPVPSTSHPTPQQTLYGAENDRHIMVLLVKMTGRQKDNDDRPGT